VGFAGGGPGGGGGGPGRGLGGVGGVGGAGGEVLRVIGPLMINTRVASALESLVQLSRQPF
jgi:hypothetical protein